MKFISNFEITDKMSGFLSKDELIIRSKELNEKKFHSERIFMKISRSLGKKFTRVVMYCNYPLVGMYFGDFVDLKRRIVIEIDGKSHRSKGLYDKRRDLRLKDAGYSVLRLDTRYRKGWVSKVQDFYSKRWDRNFHYKKHRCRKKKSKPSVYILRRKGSEDERKPLPGILCL